MSQIGDVHRLPLEDRPDADAKLERPWLLLHTPSPDAPGWAFAYGSTQVTETRLHATPLALAWTRGRSRQLERTNFYPVRVRTPVPDDTGEVIGRVTGADARIRDAFRAALGVGTGPGARTASTEPERGRVVRLTRETETALDGARFAVLITPDAYARTRRYQQLIPIYDADEVEPNDGEIESAAAWVRMLPGRMSRAILAVPGLFTGSERHRPFNPGQIAGLTAVTVDAETLRRIDEALATSFGL